MTFANQVIAAQRPIPFVGSLYRSGSAEHALPSLLRPMYGATPDLVRIKALMAGVSPEVVQANGGLMVVFDVHRLPPNVDLYIDDDGDLVAAEAGNVPPGITLFHEFFTIVRGPALKSITSSLVGDGQRFLATLTDHILPEFSRRLASSLQDKHAMQFALFMRHITEDFFQQAEDHVQALQSALLKMPKRTSHIAAYISFCEYFLGTIIREPWNAMSAIVAAAESGDWSAVAAAAQRRSSEAHTIGDLLQPVVESFWPLMAQRAAVVVIDDSVKPAMLGNSVDVDQFQQLMTRVLSRRLAAANGHRSQRVIRIDYDATMGQLRVSDNGYPVNQPYKIHWVEQQARECGWTAQVTCDAGHSVIALTPPA